MRKTSRDKQQIFSPKQIVHSGLCIGCGMCVGEGQVRWFSIALANTSRAALGSGTAGLRASFPQGARSHRAPRLSLVLLTPADRAAQARRAECDELSWRRKMIYRARSLISKWSHRMSWLAARSGCRTLYINWARLMTTLHGRLAWSQGRFGKLLDKLG